MFDYPKESRFSQLFVLLSLGAVAAAVSVQKIRSYDYWWHLRTGELISETGGVPQFDPYSFAAEGSRWIDIHWLHQLALHGLYSLDGHTAVIWAKLFLVVALITILGRIGYQRGHVLVTAVPLTLMLLVAGDRFMPRPELPSFVLLAGVLALLDRFERRGDQWIWAVVPIQLLWVNIHGLFALGIAACGIHLVAGLLWPPIRGEAVNRPRLLRLVGVTAASGLVSLCNPNFLEAALYPFQQLGMVAVPEMRVAHQSIELRSLFAAWPGMTALAKGLLVATVLLPLGAMALNHRRVRGSDLLFVAAFLFLALASKRNVPLFAIVAVPICVRNLNELLDARPTAQSGEVFGILSHVAAAGLLLFVAGDLAKGSFFHRLGAFREPGFGVMEMLYPIGAAEWIAAQKPPAPICHHSADGGYLIWRLYPDYKVMLDGRLEVYGPAKVNKLTYKSLPDFRKLDEEYRFGTVLVHYGEFHKGFLGILYKSPEWSLVFVDDVAAVFIRATQNAPWPAVNIDAPDLFPPFSDEHSLFDAYARQTRASFYAAVGRRGRANAIMAKAAERYPELLKPQP